MQAASSVLQFSVITAGQGSETAGVRTYICHIFFQYDSSQLADPVQHPQLLLGESGSNPGVEHSRPWEMVWDG